MQHTPTLAPNKTLTHHREMQDWVTTHQGIPDFSRVRNRFGEERAQLKLSFQRVKKLDPASEIDGISPCSWTAWLAELDRQQLALKVDPMADQFELVRRLDS
jgi:hypothetical protein